VNSASAAASYARLISQNGETVTLRRYSGSGDSRTATDYTPIAARVVGYQPSELVDDVQQGDRKVILLAEDVTALSFPAPVLITDKIVVRSKEMAIQAIDDSSRRVGETLIAYEIRVRG
jgi:hypothetical protein